MEYRHALFRTFGEDKTAKVAERAGTINAGAPFRRLGCATVVAEQAIATLAATALELGSSRCAAAGAG